MCATLFEPRPLSWAGLLWIARLDTESRGEPNGIPRAEIVRAAAGVHKAEGAAVVAIRGTLPPKSGGTPERSNRSATSFYRNAPNEY